MNWCDHITSMENKNINLQKPIAYHSVKPHVLVSLICHIEKRKLLIKFMGFVVFGIVFVSLLLILFSIELLFIIELLCTHSHNVNYHHIRIEDRHIYNKERKTTKRKFFFLRFNNGIRCHKFHHDKFIHILAEREREGEGEREIERKKEMERERVRERKRWREKMKESKWLKRAFIDYQ